MIGKVMTTAVAAGAIGTVIYALNDKSKRDKAKNKLQKKRSANSVEIDKNAGHPDPYDINDNTMVSEGALYAVQRYNEEVDDYKKKKRSHHN
ncbi:hypothetical protein [Alkalihalobacterium chitinilyticum]|uniref:YtxH domain-containing protein n=1 Tax=Alkalihalobacterium chitinilyticum TaxID=2980103 RepID=A0ABT5VAU0_9BACI|nr:hypothetical protein [Alkalihalobacterium chitinilyticum]MDE5412566.1 hypothetical protein [Alkalihalobacterium chitinilyticum]